ncbi:precorrin-6y C5,15-methyltransferase (decarboxylating) subunit CbiE [Gordonia sp. HNM0687]|uniref:Precorrin-6y C5,15-methyltransferase (Decarboxylating) subunit CbiE n=1 Tax=Gordonia mangrovi TaxID=2665643 RepID=A0A6L7GRV3_9ACTN|nr:precorrin-6y C5,15-methyltransferase (decarboxylating) subunit CbiE [Gordonia mangrovi]MXP22127.1 precorrin-6y C5,15-methyltransferase (decarboxylating) subunit CbiE [Gordonia mangrovi]UVF77959.1 precorrin-6y C5,15-methyltransferase (decarboxylating) subunit CbiE [Gordonia mangrovi]
MTGTFVVVGIGADGWDGLGRRARDELTGAEFIIGSRRQLDLLPDLPARREAWSSPMSAHLQRLLTDDHDGVRHILASGDPMFHGVGTTIVRAVGADRVRVLPTVSSAALACARLGWDLTDVRVVSLVTHDVSTLSDELDDDRDLLILSRDESTPSDVAKLLIANGFGWSAMTVLEQLGGTDERVVRGVARTWTEPPGDPLNLIAVGCVGPHRSRAPGRPDDGYAHDGQITKQPIRAVTVSALAPSRRQLLWDIGSGSGSVVIEWLRAEPTGRAVSFEIDPDRRDRLHDNAVRHGVHERLTTLGAAPDDCAMAPEPDAVFIGGGLDDALLTAVWDLIPAGGRLVANAVTLENQTLLTEWYAQHGGSLRRHMVETAAPLGSMTTWRPALPIVQWVVERP